MRSRCQSRGTERRGLLWGFGAVVASVALLAGASVHAETMWQVDFETALGADVIHGQNLVTNQIDGNSDLLVGNAHASLGGTTSIPTYAEYASAGVPDMPASIDPAGVAGDFAADFTATGWRITAVSSTIASNAGDANTHFAMEGFFNLQENLVTTLSGSYGSLQRTFAQQKRSNTAYQLSRLWVGMGVNDVAEGNGIPVVALKYCDTANVYHDVLGETEIAQGEWHHFALVLDTYDDTGTTKQDLRLYLDGELEASIVGLTHLAAAGSKPLALGNAPDSAFSNKSFIGYLDTVRFTDETLSPDQFLNVPEPATFALLFLGLIGFVARRRRP